MTMKLVSLASMRLYFNYEASIFGFYEVIMSPPFRVGSHIAFPRASVCPSVRLSLCLSVTNRVHSITFNVGTLVNHDETMCHAQEP